MHVQAAFASVFLTLSQHISLQWRILVNGLDLLCNEDVIALASIHRHIWVRPHLRSFRTVAFAAVRSLLAIRALLTA